jgi:copper transport protein
MRRHFGLALGLGLGLALVPFSIALAHAVLLSAAPNPNSLFPPNDPPTQVTVTFSEEVVPAFSSVRVLNQAGEVVDTGDTHADNSEKTVLAVSLKPLQPGTYTVAWEVISAVDGHANRGSYVFGVGVEAVAPVGMTNAVPVPSPISLGARWLTLTGQILLLGLFAFRFFVWWPTLNPQTDEQLDLAMARQAIGVGWVGLALVGFGLLLTLVTQWDVIGGSTFSELIERLQVWLGTSFGGMWVIRFGLGAGLAFGLADLSVGLREGRAGLKGWEWWAGLAASVALALTSTFTSHSAALQAGWELAVASDGTHLLAAGVWVGGLVQLVIATHFTRALPGKARLHHNLNLVLNFSVVAAIAVGVLLVSGAYLAWQHVGTWAALFKTTHGLTLLVKTALALPTFAIAALNLMVVKPRLAAVMSKLDRDPTLIQRRFHRLVMIEAGFALAIVAAAGFLTDFQRGRDALLLTEQSRVVLSESADDLAIRLTIEPARWGEASAFDVYLLGADNKPVLTAREVSLRFKFLDRTLGTNTITAVASGDGHYRAQGNYLSLSGAWEIEVAIRRMNAFDAFAIYQVNNGADGVSRPQDSSATLTEGLLGRLTYAGGFLTGSLLILFALVWVVPAVQAARGKISFALLLLPSLAALAMGAIQLVEAISGQPIAALNDPRALALLTESDAAMNHLTSVKLLRTTRGDDENGPVLIERMILQAPNLFHDIISNGSENMAQGNIVFLFNNYTDREDYAA